MNHDGALAHRKQLALAQLAQYAVDVNGGQAQRIGEHELAQGALEFGFCGLTDQAQPLGELHEEMGRAFQRAAPANAVRAFTYLLHPPDLQREGLSATLGRYVDGFGKRTGLKITVKSCHSVDQLSLPLQQTLLRIVQEALTNVYRHASATCVSVNFRCVGKRLRLVISDDGQGTEESSGHHNGKPFRLGVGIPGMMARVQQFGGNLDVRTGANGTVVQATVPFG